MKTYPLHVRLSQNPSPAPSLTTKTRLSMPALCLAALSLNVAPVFGQTPTIGGGTLADPALNCPAPAYSYGYGTAISQAVAVKNWDFGTGSGSTVPDISTLTANFQYHDQFGRDHGSGYGSSIVAPPGAPVVSGQPVEGVNTAAGDKVREFLSSSLKTYLVPLNGATTADPALRNVGNGGFQAKWTAPNGGSLLGMDIIWETRVRYVTPPYFWFAIWTCGDHWTTPNPSAGVPGGAEMDLIESFGYNNGGSYTNFDGRYWHSNAVGGNEEGAYSGWGTTMANYGITTFDATQWHIWTWVYHADNTYTAFVDGMPVQRGKINWTDGGNPTDPAINMSFIFDAAWGHQTVGGMAGFTLPVSQLAGKYYEWDYSRIYYREPTANDIRNLALNATISSSSGGGVGSEPYRAIDDIYNTDTNRWSPSSSGFPRFIEIDLGANKLVNETQFVTYANRAYQYRIETKPDGGAYTTVSDQTASTNTSPLRTDSFTPVTARYVKVTYTGSPNGATWVGIREIRVMGRPTGTQSSSDLALNQPASASTVAFGDPTYAAGHAVDGNSTTRWRSKGLNDQWIYVDLGTAQSVSRVKLNWESAYASGYKIQVSPDASTWTDIYSTTTGDGNIDDLTGLSGSGRYVRVLAVTNATGSGISLWDFEVYGPGGNPPPPSDLALNQPATAATVAFGSPTYAAGNAVDGNTTTRWASKTTPNQWIYVDLGTTQSFTRVNLKWATDYATGYKIQSSPDATTWTDVYTTTTGDGNTDDVTGLTGSGRYVRIYATTTATTNGISLWDFEIYP